MALNALAQRSGTCSTSFSCHSQNVRLLDQQRGNRAALASQHCSARRKSTESPSKRMKCVAPQATATDLSVERKPGAILSRTPFTTWWLMHHVVIVIDFVRVKFRTAVLSTSQQHCPCSKSGHGEERNKGDEGGGQHQSRWHWRVQLQLPNSLSGSYVGREAPS